MDLHLYSWLKKVFLLRLNEAMQCSTSVASARVILESTVNRKDGLERLLKGQGKGNHPCETEGVRMSIREGYEQVMMHAPCLAADNDADHQMWKFCFYGPVEYFRTSMRRAARAAIKASEGSRGGGSEEEAKTKLAAAAKKELKAVQGEFKSCIAIASRCSYCHQVPTSSI